MLMTRDVKYFPLNLYNARTSINMTRFELADKIDTSERIIYDYENGIKFPSGPTLVKIANALEQTIDYFFLEH